MIQGQIHNGYQIEWVLELTHQVWEGSFLPFYSWRPVLKCVAPFGPPIALLPPWRIAAKRPVAIERPLEIPVVDVGNVEPYKFQFKDVRGSDEQFNNTGGASDGCALSPEMDSAQVVGILRRDGVPNKTGDAASKSENC